MFIDVQGQLLIRYEDFRYLCVLPDDEVPNKYELRIGYWNGTECYWYATSGTYEKVVAWYKETKAQIEKLSQNESDQECV